ncbi:MAG: hypothetical protein HDR12_15945 [Lachnospiraceae bacterium]|nr:hypothetical protein [Lachnospiraceae bacterium]
MRLSKSLTQPRKNRIRKESVEKSAVGIRENIKAPAFVIIVMHTDGMKTRRNIAAGFI